MSRPKAINPDAPYQSPRATAYLTGLAHGYILQGCKDGTIPHIRVGTDYRINLPAFLEQLDRESRKTAPRAGTPESGKMENSLNGMISAQNYSMVHDSEQVGG